MAGQVLVIDCRPMLAEAAAPVAAGMTNPMAGIAGVDPDSMASVMDIAALTDAEANDAACCGALVTAAGAERAAGMGTKGSGPQCNDIPHPRRLGQVNASAASDDILRPSEDGAASCRSAPSA